MNHEHHQIGAAAARLADRLPHSVMIAVAEAVALHGGMDRLQARQAILQSLPTPDFRDATADFLDLWHCSAASVGAEAVAVALVTAAKSEQDHRHAETVEIVWTGPEPAETRFRQTEQAILEVVNSATRRLTVVSYAVYRIPRIREALVAAANRGVVIRLIVETPTSAIHAHLRPRCFHPTRERRRRELHPLVRVEHLRATSAQRFFQRL